MSSVYLVIFPSILAIVSQHSTVLIPPVFQSSKTDSDYVKHIDWQRKIKSITIYIMFSLELKVILVASSYQNRIIYRHMKQELMINFLDTKIIWLDTTNLLCNMQSSCYFSYQQCLNTCRLSCIIRKRKQHIALFMLIVISVI